jgi:hypothetical protein
MIVQQCCKSADSIRAFTGVVTNFPDARSFAQFTASFRYQTQLTIGDVTFDIVSCHIIRDGNRVLIGCIGPDCYLSQL